MASHIEDYSAAQLESLAAKKRAEERPDIVDFQTRGVKQPPDMYRGTKTVDIYGMEIVLDRSRLDNWHLMELMPRLNTLDIEAIYEAMDIAIGRDVRERLMAHLAEVSPSGYPRISDVNDAIEEIFGDDGVAKNS